LWLCSVLAEPLLFPVALVLPLVAPVLLPVLGFVPDVVPVLFEPDVADVVPEVPWAVAALPSARTSPSAATAMKRLCIIPVPYGVLRVQIPGGSFYPPGGRLNRPRAHRPHPVA
jgi:hypothetical protein